ncbi:2-hydroxy-palmitic acid dioxygenase MPO1-like [Syzygium oleosum]|uniref:2-hydroxy-palmitic acid dioxygenase MPO1-like n=1 Tax=Syzygium oleosum TaxID=219896 RepID=UPI0011D29C36|nr:2-hydroxy-palmitic acid dioxygenase MPO1-like [Syzygium oleosum]
MGRKGLFDLEKHFASYGAYHSNPVNILIHTVSVWPIFFTALVLLYFTPTICQLFNFQPQCFLARHGLFLNLGFFCALLYAVFYVCMDIKAGSLAALLCMVCWVGASWLASYLGFSLAWKVVLAAQLFCWTGQFLGHGVFEKRAPALLDNLVQAFLMAPFFVLLEVLQTVFGYEPYQGFHASVKLRIDAEIADWKEKKQKMGPYFL